MTCQHVSTATLQPPRATQAVHREDCTQCFDSIDDAQGLNVCLSCFNGGCCGERNHSSTHHKLSQHSIVLNVRRTKKPKPERDEPPQKISKLAIEAESESDKYDTQTALMCLACGGRELDRTQGKLPEVIDGVLTAMTFARQTEVQAWEQEIVTCEHTLTLDQEPAKQLESQNLAHCAKCDLNENLWLCLTCGNLGCGRAQFGGVGGNSHGLSHYDDSKHPVSVKLGSITPEGTCDIYCYACNDEKTDPDVAKHLQHWGINIAERQKTEKSLTEMQIEQNLKWEFAMTSEDGKELRPLFGPGFTGLKNLGNSCYLASILQCLYSIPVFKKRYYDVISSDGMPETLNPAEDLETQLRKIADGLLSGRYSKPDSDVKTSEHSSEVPHQKGLAPAMLKSLIGKGHEEFSTMRQQDAFELLQHLFQHIEKSRHPAELGDPIDEFRFVHEQRLQCLSCKKVAYKQDIQENISIPVPAHVIETPDIEFDGEGGAEAGKEKEAFRPVTIKECLDIFTADEVVEFGCKACGGKAGARKRSGFKTLPNVLVINCRRFKLVNWVPVKLDVPVIVPDEPFSMDSYMSAGLQPGEEALPEDAAEEAPSFQANEAAVAHLEAMGFPRVRCEKALYNTGNQDPEQAMNWLFEHMDDADIDAPLVLPSAGASKKDAISDDSIDMVCAMGFSKQQATKALTETKGNMEAAVSWLFDNPDGPFDVDEPMPEAPTEGKPEPGSKDTPASFRLESIVCHKGGSIHAGHYVAFIRKLLDGVDEEGGEGWVLFNDEKVVRSGGDAAEMKKFAYVYFFKRC